MKLYCEKYRKKEFALMDFNIMSDVRRWTELIDHNYVWNELDRRSMLNIQGIRYSSYLGPREGRWYDIPDEFWRNFNVTFRNFSENESNIYRADLEIKKDNYFDIEKFRVKDGDEPTYSDELIDFKIPTSKLEEIELPYKFKYEDDGEFDNLNIIVEGVGQGNWNEIRSSKFRMIYDLGADDSWSLNQLQNLIGKMKIINSNNLYIVLSHWDIDHYHAILGMDSKEIKKINRFIAPTLIPQTCTFSRVWNLLISNGIHPSLISPTRKVGKRGIRLVEVFRYGCIRAFRATKGKSANQCGIVLLIEGKRKNALLTGDHHYNKLYDDVISQISCKNKDFLMVIPHHGGDAGKMNTKMWSMLHNPEGVISFGINNKYGHPTKAVEKFLKNANFKISRTYGKNQFIYNL